MVSLIGPEAWDERAILSPVSHLDQPRPPTKIGQPAHRSCAAEVQIADVTGPVDDLPACLRFPEPTRAVP